MPLGRASSAPLIDRDITSFQQLAWESRGVLRGGGGEVYLRGQLTRLDWDPNIKDENKDIFN